MKCSKRTVLKNATQRGMVIHAVQGSADKPFPLVDLVPEESKGIRGTYTITIEFNDEGLNTEHYDGECAVCRTRSSNLKRPEPSEPGLCPICYKDIVGEDFAERIARVADNMPESKLCKACNANK